MLIISLKNLFTGNYALYSEGKIHFFNFHGKSIDLNELSMDKESTAQIQAINSVFVTTKDGCCIDLATGLSRTDKTEKNFYKDMIATTCAYKKYIFLSNQGQVYTISTQEMGKSLPQLVTQLNNQKIIRITSYNGTILALSQAGRVFAWGQNILDNYLGSDYCNKDTPTLLSIPEKIIDILASSNSVCALTEDGRIYTWGYNTCGQLGHGNTDDYNHPAKVDGIYDIKQILLVNEETLMVLTRDSIYAAGKFGVKDRFTFTNLTKNYLKNETPVLATVSDHKNLVIFLTNKNNIYYLGKNNTLAKIDNSSKNEFVRGHLLSEYQKVSSREIKYYQNNLFTLNKEATLYQADVQIISTKPSMF